MHEKKKMNLPLKITLIIALLFAVGFLLTFSPTCGAAAVFCLIVGLVGNYKDQEPDRRKDAPAVRIISMVLVAGLLFAMPPLTMTSSAVWRYPFQKAYIGMYQNIKEPEWFPDFLNDVESDYYFDYMPSIMQGTGHYSTEFVTSPERAAGYAEQFAGQACYVIPLREYDYNYTIDEKPLSIYTGRDFWSGEEDAVIYVLSAVLDWNHPHSSAVIVDKTTGKVQLTQLG